jgi:hypothetical protein
MAAKKRPGKQEPLLNSVARKLGHAAGTFTKVTHKWTDSLSALPGAVTAQVQGAAVTIAPAKRSRALNHPPKRKTGTPARPQSVRLKTKAGRRRSASGRKAANAKR